jgi:hypothetical protein
MTSRPYSAQSRLGNRWTGEDHQEALRAFFEKRDGDYRRR